MSTTSDSSFSFQSKKRQQFNLSAQPHQKLRRNTVEKAVLNIKTLDLPLISRYDGKNCESLFLEPYKPYTIGRKLELCDFIFTDRRVSKRHCQLYFDSLEKKIYLLDGFFLGYSGCNDSFSSFSANVSTNGAFVNGVRISGIVELRVGDVVSLVCGNEKACILGASIGFSVEKAVFLEEVDYRSLSQLSSNNVHTEQNNVTPKLCRLIDNTSVLLSWCRDILCSDDPVSYIQKFVILNQENRMDLSFRNGLEKCSGLFSDNGFKFCLSSRLQIGCPKRKRVYSREIETVENCNSRSQKEIIEVSEGNNELGCSNFVVGANADIAKQKEIVEVSEGNNELECSNFVVGANADIARQKEIIEVSEGNNELEGSNFVVGNNAEIARQKSGGVVDIHHAGIASSNSTGREISEAENCGVFILPPGRKFYLNRLKFRGQDYEDIGDVVSLPELFHPIENIKQVFIATFTSDILWFVSYCKIPPHLPVTIACHSAERCWSSDPDKRASIPFPDFPNLTVVYPAFPEVIAFNNDRKNSGIACHHPKLIVLQREDRLRVVITSANLVEKQWQDVTNTVWWQDFPRLSFPNCFSLFTQLSVGEINVSSKCDFAAQLAGFMASLLADVPGQAHWILELIKYDFKEAAGYLVASVPGIYSQRNPSLHDSKYHLVGNKHAQQSCGAKFLSSVEASVVGLSHIYRVSADSNGEHLKKLALFLGKFHENMDGLSEIVLRRETNIRADGNAVSVLIPNPEKFSVGDFVQLGFLPRNFAKWVAPLSDSGLFTFSAYIHPKEVLETALEGSSKKVKLILYVYEGPSFSTISEVTRRLEYASAICSLVASSQRHAGLWRIKEVLSQYKWPEHLESDFFFSSSSVGCLNAQFLAAFAAAAGKTSVPFSDSEESDPDWGCWTASQELKNPSVRIIFPSIERVKTNRSGIMASRRMLCFSQKTWQRLERVGILHDAIPYPYDRVGFPMHVKVGRRRFQSKKDGSSFGWVYCGSHNFSAAAWGRPISDRQSNGNLRNNSVLGSRLHISNYELGIIFIVPPPDAVDYVKQNSRNLDDIVLPFVVPPPKYRPTDKPATAQALREALKELSEQEREIHEAVSAADGDWMEEGITEMEEEVLETAQYITQEKEDEKAYADKLWSQVDSSESC